MEISDDKLEQALRYLTDGKHEGPKARAAHEYLSDMTKVVLAKLMSESEEKSAAAKEMWARAQPSYQQHLEQIKAAAELDYIWRDRRSASSAIIEMWRTQQSNARAAERVR